MAITITPAAVRPDDFDRIVKPMACDFADAMCARFAGNDVMPTTVWFFLSITGTESYEHAASWLYEVKTMEQMRRIEQHRRAKLQGSANA